MNKIYAERKQYQKLRYNRYQKKVIVAETLTGWSFLSPLLVVAIIFSTVAIVIALYLTFFKGDFKSLEFVGLDNWKAIFSPGVKIGQAFKNTLLYAAVSVPTITIVALIVSAVLNSRVVKRKELFLAIFFLPQVTSGIATTLIFSQLFSGDSPFKMDYYLEPQLALWIVIISAIWGGVAGSLITMNTAFTTIDKTQYEAADLDGANGLRKFLNVTVPSIGPIIAYSFFMGIIGGLGVFDGPYLMAGSLNIPESGLTTLILAGYLQIIPSSTATAVNLGLGSAILFFTALIMAIATYLANFFMPLSRKTY